MKKRPDLQFDEAVFDDYANRDFDYVEQPPERGVFLFVGGFALLFLFLAFARVVFLSVIRGNFYAVRAETNVNREVTLPANRGIITDRFGEVLASNIGTFSVFIDVPEILKQEGALDGLVTAFSGVLSVSEVEIRDVISKTDLERGEGLAVIRDVTAEEAIKVKTLNLSHVSVKEDYTRKYADPVFSSLLGYTGSVDSGSAIVGKTGLEAYYDPLLRGKDGVHVFYRNVKGEVFNEKVIADPVPGQELRTTIDAGFERYFSKRLTAGLTSLGLRSGVGLAINPQTGEVLALVNIPVFDNNVFVNRRASEERAKLLTDPLHPLFNRALSGAYNPGSVIKPLVALAALHEKVVDPTFQIYSPGYITLPNPYFPDKPSVFLDWRPQGWVDIHSALARSSNVYFYEVGGGFQNLVGLGIDRLRKYWQYFGFGTKTGIDLDQESTGFLPSPDEKEARTGQIWRIGDTYNVSIGQGDFLATPIQVLNLIASIANDGIMYVPRLVKDHKSSQVALDYSSWSNELKEVHQGMIDGVQKSYGTSYLLHDLPFAVAAKTGSAQIENNTKTNAFFVGYEASNHPQIAILVLIENSKEGSLNAVPVAKDVLNWYYENRIQNKKTDAPLTP